MTGLNEDSFPNTDTSQEERFTLLVRAQLGDGAQEPLSQLLLADLNSRLGCASLPELERMGELPGGWAKMNDAGQLEPTDFGQDRFDAYAQRNGLDGLTFSDYQRERARFGEAVLVAIGQSRNHLKNF